MKIVKWLLVLILTMGSAVFASEVLFSENFTTNPFPERWRTHISDGGYVKWDSVNKWVVMTMEKGTDCNIWLISYKGVKGDLGKKYKLSVTYKLFPEIALYERPSVAWLHVYHHKLPCSNKWKESSVLIEPYYYTNDESIQFGCVTFAKKYDCFLYIDKVELRKCLTGIEPNSLGKIKVLYN